MSKRDREEWFTCLEYPQWIFKKPSIASGTEGSIYTACKSQNGDCAYVAKFYILEDDENEEHFQNEVAAYRILNTETREEALAPKMHDSFKCQSKYLSDTARVYGILILDDLAHSWDRVSPQQLVRDFVRLTHSLLRRHGMVQGDIHYENIMYDSNNRAYLVDFGHVQFDFPRDRQTVPYFQQFKTMANVLSVSREFLFYVLKEYFPDDKRLY